MSLSPLGLSQIDQGKSNLHCTDHGKEHPCHFLAAILYSKADLTKHCDLFWVAFGRLESGGRIHRQQNSEGATDTSPDLKLI